MLFRILYVLYFIYIFRLIRIKLYYACYNARVTSEALTAEKFRNSLAQLSLSTGFPTHVTPYAIRRGAANSIEGKATDAQRNQIMGHHRNSVFQFYISQCIRVDMQSVFLGSTPRSEVGEMLLNMDLRFPTALSKDQTEALQYLPQIKEV